MRISRLDIMKYTVVAMIVAYIVVLVINLGGSSKPFEVVAASVQAGIHTENLGRADDQRFRRNYGYNVADFDGVLLYASQFRLSAEEVLLIKVKSTSQVNEVRQVIEERLQSRRQDFDGYAPEQVQLIDQAQLVVRGNYIFLAVGQNADEYRKLFLNSL